MRRVCDHRGRRAGRRGADRRADAGDADDDAAPVTQTGVRRSCSTWVCAPTRRRSRCGAPPTSTTPGRSRRRGRSSRATTRWRRAVGRRSPTGRGASAASRALAQEQPRSSLVQLEYGLAFFWRGDGAAAKAAWRAARRRAAGHVVRAPRRGSAPPELPARAAARSCRASPRRRRWRRLSPPKQLAYLRAHATDDRWPPSLRRRLPAARAGSSRRCASSSGVGGRRGPGRARGRPLRQGRSLADVLPPRPAGAALSRRTRASASTSGFACSGSAASTKAKQELRLARAAGPKTPLGTEAQPLPASGCRESRDRLTARWAEWPMASVRCVWNTAAFC